MGKGKGWHGDSAGHSRAAKKRGRKAKHKKLMATHDLELKRRRSGYYSARLKKGWLDKLDLSGLKHIFKSKKKS